MNKGTVFAEDNESISMIVVTEFDDEEVRLAERYYDNSDSINWTEYWCPIEEIENRPISVVSENAMDAVAISQKLADAENIEQIEREYGLR